MFPAPVLCKVRPIRGINSPVYKKHKFFAHHKIHFFQRTAPGFLESDLLLLIKAEA
jgi:hypothetical protein